MLRMMLLVVEAVRLVCDLECGRVGEGELFVVLAVADGLNSAMIGKLLVVAERCAGGTLEELRRWLLLVPLLWWGGRAEAEEE
jgi:hypothetical protein